jgi:excisionase family DNA binding protein
MSNTATFSAAPSSATPGRKLGDVNVVAGKLSCSTRHIYRLADAGRMPAPLRLGTLVRWELDEIDRWIAAGCPSCRKGARL